MKLQSLRKKCSKMNLFAKGRKKFKSGGGTRSWNAKC